LNDAAGGGAEQNYCPSVGLDRDGKIDLRDKKVLITGAAGGLGTAITLAFAKGGASVQALDIAREKGQALLAECARQNSPPASVRFVSGDLSDLPAIGALLRGLCREENGSIFKTGRPARYR
jgi:3-oxoacyl-[acyl-carrier protein] reductase